MKINQKTAIISAFVLGAIVLVISAFADTMLGSGYSSLKNAIKTTASKLSKEVDSFTANGYLTIRMDGNIIEESITNGKFDILNDSRESQDNYSKKGEQRQGYWYSNADTRIYRNDDGSYNVIERQKTKDKNQKLVENPFEQEQVKDMEKLLDVFVGNLQDIIQVEESGGKKMYTGALTETQIPSTINAISSFAFKYGILDQRQAKDLEVPYPKSNIYLLDAMGKAIENEEGIIESGILTINMSYEDEQGEPHIYSIDVSVEIKDINNTIVTAPDLKGKTVTYSKEGFEFEDKYIGKYKNDIVLEKDNSFEKIGERFIEISSIENGSLKGKYYEVYKEGHETDKIRSFDFYSNPDIPGYFTIIEYKDDKGEDKKAIIHRDDIQNIRMSFDVEIDEENSGYSYSHNVDGFNNTFIRVLD